MIHISNPAECCGCSACASICNHDAITMKPDALGFLYPVVDKKCIDCGLCERVCAFNDHYDTSFNLPEPIVYGARHKDTNEVMKSRSGAVFAALSDYILEQGGVIYGAGYTDHFRVVHKRAAIKEERDEFRGSKYVQSDINSVFRHVKNDLQEGLSVLFSGTPCQTSGLNSYIGKKLRSKLVLVDIICHGVSGPFLWRDYIKYLEEKENSKIIWVNFRDKEQFGWVSHRETFRFESSPEQKRWLNKRFYSTLMLRHSCMHCHFCNIIRPSDITIGDYWGWQKSSNDINSDNKGVNLVLINTEKGKNLFQKVERFLIVDTVENKSYLQPNLQKPTKEHKFRRQFENEYVEKGFKYVFEKTYDERPKWKQILSHIYEPIIKVFNR